MKKCSGVVLKRILRTTKTAFSNIAASFESVRVIMGHFCTLISTVPNLETQLNKPRFLTTDNSAFLSDDL
jgi:hypothetical protein